LRNQMKQCSADLRAQLDLAAERQAEAVQQSAATYSRPPPRVLSW